MASNGLISCERRAKGTAAANVTRVPAASASRPLNGFVSTFVGRTAVDGLSTTTLGMSFAKLMPRATPPADAKAPTTTASVKIKRCTRRDEAPKALSRAS